MAATPVSRVLVTGGASGLGAALVEAFTARGDQVLVGDVLDPEPDPGGGAAVVRRQLDVRSDEDWAAARDWVESNWGGLDVLVNNAGVAGGGRVDVASMAEWQWITEINLFGVVRGTRTFVPVFKRQRAGQRRRRHLRIRAAGRRRQPYGAGLRSRRRRCPSVLRLWPQREAGPRRSRP